MYDNYRANMPGICRGLMHQHYVYHQKNRSWRNGNASRPRHDPAADVAEFALNGGIHLTQVTTIDSVPGHGTRGGLPRTEADFGKRFGSEEACRDYLFRMRWPEGFRCPRCREAKAWRLRSALWQCASCGYQASLTAGTIFQDTRTPLRVWFRALWWMTSQKNGVSALGLQRVLGLGSYQTAWCWLHKLRRAMVRP